MVETEKNEILLAIAKLDNKMDNMQEQISEMQKEVAKIPDMQKEIDKISEMQREIAKIPELQEELKNISRIVIPEMQEEIRKISKSVAVIELEHGEKLDLLFDIFDMQQEKLRSHDRKIQLCERHLDRHDDEIYYLKEFLRA